MNIRFEPSEVKVQEREVEILGDDLNEGDEWFIVTLSRVSLTSMCYKIENGTLNMTIGDDDGTFVCSTHIICYSYCLLLLTLYQFYMSCVYAPLCGLLSQDGCSQCHQ